VILGEFGSYWGHLHRPASVIRLARLAALTCNTYVDFLSILTPVGNGMDMKSPPAVVCSFVPVVLSTALVPAV